MLNIFFVHLFNRKPIKATAFSTPVVQFFNIIGLALIFKGTLQVQPEMFSILFAQFLEKKKKPLFASFEAWPTIWLGWHTKISVICASTSHMPKNSENSSFVRNYQPRWQSVKSGAITFT